MYDLLGYLFTGFVVGLWGEWGRRKTTARLKRLEEVTLLLKRDWEQRRGQDLTAPLSREQKAALWELELLTKFPPEAR